MSAGINLAETTIFVPGGVFGSVTKELGENRLTVWPHPFSATHHNLKDSIVVSGRMVDVDGLYSCLARTLARTLTTHGLNELNNPIFISPFE